MMKNQFFAQEVGGFLVNGVDSERTQSYLQVHEGTC